MKSPSMIAKPLGPSDIQSLPEVQPADWDDIRPIHEFYTRSSFCIPIKVLSEGKMAGIGTAIVHHDVAWLAHIIVAPDFRKRGIGRFITGTLVSLAKDKGVETVFLKATELGAPVYQKAGFELETEYLYFPEVSLQQPYVQDPGILPYHINVKDQIREIDIENSAEDRMFHLEGYLPEGFVFQMDGQTEGFYLPTFGNGLISVRTESAGLALMKFHLQSSSRICFPKENLSATAFLYEEGCREKMRIKRMRYGKKRNLKLGNIYNRIGGNLG